MASKELAKVDQQLLELADQGASGVEMEAETNIPAAEAMMRVKRILEQKDWLSVKEQEKLNILAMQKVKNRLLKEASQKYADKDTTANFIQAIKVMSEMLEKASQVNEDHLSVITSSQARAMQKLFSLAWDEAVAALVEQFPDAPVALITDVFNDGLREAAKEIVDV